MPTNATTIAQLVTRALQRADLDGSTFVTEAEVIGYINVAMAEIHDLIVQKYEDYYMSDTSIDIGASNPANLPSDFYKALGVDLQTGGINYRLRPYSFQERNAFNSPANLAVTPSAVRYHIQGSQIKFIPSSASGTATLYYVPEAQQFATSGSGYADVTVATKAPALATGYEEFLVVDAAIKCLLKEEADVRPHLAQKKALIQRIEDAASNRDAGEPYAITDVNVGTYRDDPYGGV